MKFSILFLFFRVFVFFCLSLSLFFSSCMLYIFSSRFLCQLLSGGSFFFPLLSSLLLSFPSLPLSCLVSSSSYQGKDTKSNGVVVMHDTPPLFAFCPFPIVIVFV